MPNSRLTVADFLTNVKKDGPTFNPELGPCWVWMGGRFQRGYGQLSKGHDRYAHRASYRLFVGEIPVKKLIRHLCNNPPCVNPSHLAAGTLKENYHDAVVAGRASHGQRNGQAKRHPTSLVNEIKQQFSAGVPQFVIAKQLGLSKTYVCNIIKGRRRRNG